MRFAWWFTAWLIVGMLACRLTAGPPARPTPTAAPVTPPVATATARLPNLVPARTPLPSPTPVRLPSQPPSPTPLSFLPTRLPVLSPENFAYVRRLARLSAAGPLPLADIDFSPDGQRLAAITCYQTVQMWDLPSGQLLAAQAASGSDQCSPDLRLDFSPAWQLLATSGSISAEGAVWGVVRLWPQTAAEALPETYTLTATRKAVTTVAFSPDGRLLAAGTSEFSVKLWYVPAILENAPPKAGQLASAPPLADLAHSDWVVDVAFSPDGKLLAAATALTENGQTEYVVMLWDIGSVYTEGEESIQAIRTLRANHGPLWQVAFSPDGQLLAGAGAGLTLWEVASGTAVATLDLPLETLAFAPSGRVLAAAGSDLLALWNLEAPLTLGTPVPKDLVLLRGAGKLVQLAYAPDGRALASLSEDGSLDLWGISP